MNNEQEDQQQNLVPSADGETNTNKSSSSPHVNHSVQYSIETNIESNLDADKMPSIPMETITNDLNEMQKIMKNGFKVSTDHLPTTVESKNPLITTSKTITTTLTNDQTGQSVSERKSAVSSFFAKQKQIPDEHEIIERFDDSSKINYDGEIHFVSQEKENNNDSSDSLDTMDPAQNMRTMPITVLPSTNLSILHHKLKKEEFATEGHSGNIIDNEDNIVGTTREVNMENLSYATTLAPANEVSKNAGIIQGKADNSLISDETVVNSFSTLHREDYTVMPMVVSVDSLTQVDQDNERKTMLSENKNERFNESNTDDASVTTENSSVDLLLDDLLLQDDEMHLQTDHSSLQTEGFVTEIDHVTEFVVQTTPVPPKASETSEFPLKDAILSVHNSVHQDIGKTEQSKPIILKENLELVLDDLVLADLDNFNKGSDDLMSNQTNQTNTQDYDYINLGVGESIEIGGTFPTYPDIVTETASSTTDRFNSFDYDSYFDYPSDGIFADTAPALDISSILSDIDFSKIDFQNLDLSAVDLTGVDLGSLDLSKLPSNFSLKNFDMSKMPTNINLETLDLSTLPKDFSISGIDISGINTSDISNFDFTNIFSKPSNDRKTGNLDISNYPSRFDLSEINFSEPEFSQNGPPRFERPPLHHLPINPSRRPPFLPHNYVFSNNDNSSPDRPHPFLPMPLHFRHPHRSNFNPSNRPQFFLVDNFGNGQLVDPQNIGNSQQSRGVDPNLLSIHQQSSVPNTRFINISPNEKEIRNTQKRIENMPPFFTRNERNPVTSDHRFRQNGPPRGFNHNILPNGREGSYDFSRPSPNYNSGNIDISHLGLTGFPSEINLRNIDLSNLPSNFSLQGLDLSKLSSIRPSGSVDLSNIDLSNIDISKFIDQQRRRRPTHENAEAHHEVSQGFAMQDFDYASFFDYEDDERMNINYQAPIRAEITPGSRQWVTEEEADKHLVDELGISHLVKMSRSLTFDGNG